MKKFSKLLAMVLAVSMVLTMFVGAYNDAADIDEDKAEAVATVYNYGIMMGNDKGEFNPKDNLTRDEMAKILYVLKSIDQSAKSVYGVLANEFDDASDIPTWSKNFVGYAAAKNIIVGNDKNEVNALGNLSYIEAAIVLLRTLGLEAQYDYTVGEDKFDGFTGTKWFSNALFAADNAGLLADLDVEDFKAAITREDVAVMIANAIGYAEDNSLTVYKLAAPVAGVVIAEGENDDEEATLVIDGVEEEILLGDLDIEDLLGKKIEAVVENGEVVAYTVADSATYEDVALGDISFSDEDEDEGDDYVEGEEALVFGEDVVVENIYECDFYAFINGGEGVKYADPGALLASKIAADGAYQTATFVISEGVVAAFYAPFSFTVVDPATIKEDYDEDDGWTGEFFIDADNDGAWDEGELAIDGDYAELEDPTTLVTKTIGDELIVIDTLDEVDGSKLTITKNSSNEYIVKLDGEEAIILDEAGEAWYYANQGTDAIESMIVYGNLILDAVAAEVEEDDDFFYAIVKDWTEAMVTDVDDADEDDDDTDKINVVTITLVTEDGEVEVEAKATTADALGIAKNTIYEVREDGFTAVKLYGALVTEKDGEDMTIAGAAVEAADVAFVNLTDDAELADIEIAANGVITVDGAKVKYNTVKAFWIEVEVDSQTTAPTGATENVYVVVYDNTGDFGIYADILAGQDVE